jgi:hypothetical protein
MSKPFNDRGYHTIYPAFWVAQMSKTSKAFELLLRVRALYPRIKRVLGEQWIENNDPRSHIEMEEFVSRWEDKDQTILRESCKLLNIGDAYKHMRSMLFDFDPMWNKLSDGEATIFNPRFLTREKENDQIMVECLKRDLKAFWAMARIEMDDTEYNELWWMIQNFYRRTRKVLGEHWLKHMEGMGRVYRLGEMDAFISGDESNDEFLPDDACNEIKSMLFEFDPMWDCPINPRTEEERMYAKIEVESLKINMKAIWVKGDFDAPVAPDSRKRLRSF